MIVEKNLPAIEQQAKASQRVLDIGGWYRPLNVATHVLDIMPYATRRQHDALDPNNPERFSAQTWTVADICRAPWPYADKFFDFAFCSHTLEDIRDPVAVVGEISRVAKAGYIEVPSRAREIFSKSRWFGLKTILGRMPEIGYSHHRWFVDIDTVRAHLTFQAKTIHSTQDRDFYITRRQLGRKMRQEESGAYLFWQNNVTASEEIVIDSDALATGMRDFRSQTLRRLKTSSK
jgi:hypothetical protein